MDYGLQIKGSDGSQTGFQSIPFEQYIGHSHESHIPVTCSQQHLTYESSIKTSKQYVIGDNLQSNELGQYDSICSQNTYIDPRDANNFSKFKRSSLRGRRRYRRTLLRNYEQPFGTNITTNISYLEAGDETEINTQKRVFLRNTTMNASGVNHINVKYNSSSEQYTKVPKPSWDGGRLVKLLQGHGLNIKNYEKNTESLSNENWNSKQSSVLINNSDIQTNNSRDTDNNCYMRSAETINHQKVYNGNEKNIIPISDYNATINKGSNYLNVRINNCIDKDIMNSKCTIQTNEMIQFNQLNCVEDTNSSKQYCYSGDYIVNDDYRNQNIEKDQQISNSEFTPNQNNASQYLQNKVNVIFSQKKSFFESISSQPDVKSNYQQINKSNDKIALNTEVQNFFSSSERGNESAIQPTLPPKFLFDTSHEELFVTLGDTPTSKTGYNISSLFIPNQDS
ncbi:hypothetical protein FG379_002898 [Cryptosporidium bovis]|uniref:uncharacterized protein n=1 Tax=Cryptosporidium bovis TaxID=310047 RepID=UPI003519F9CA|nr:hypothetical protein FG379_002898 [Cryptosporidium bovis]